MSLIQDLLESYYQDHNLSVLFPSYVVSGKIVDLSEAQFITT